MKTILASLGLATGLAISPLAIAQEAATPAPAQPEQPAEAPAPTAFQKALAGLYVTVLQDAEGGVASVQNEAEESAILVFLTPEAAQAAKTDMDGADMSAQVVPMMAVLAQWNGPIAFEGSASEIEQAKTLAPEAEGFTAPAYFVTSEGQEIQIQTQTGEAITPILLSHDQAVAMTKQLESQGLDGSKVEIVPMEFAAVLDQMVGMKQDLGYRLLTHPGTAAVIQAQREAAQTTEGGQP